VSAVSVDSTVLKVNKPKERCKYHPNCTKQFCEYYHPTAPCKSFPNCKFADKCMYSHPKCKFDMACMSIDCNYAHGGQRDLSHVQLAAPPLCKLIAFVFNFTNSQTFFLIYSLSRHPSAELQVDIGSCYIHDCDYHVQVLSELFQAGLHLLSSQALPLRQELRKQAGVHLLPS